MLSQREKIALASSILFLSPLIAVTARSEVYMSSEEAVKILFPSEAFKKNIFELKDEEKRKIEELSNTHLKTKNINVFISPDGSMVFLDQVIGKHEQILYAVGITKTGTVQGIEILEYRESYGHQIRREAWRKQFIGKDKNSNLKNSQDIKNISGATLSSTHVTDGVRKILQTYEFIKKRI